MAYIDQKAAVDAVKKVIGNLDHECKPMMDFYSALWNVPAADVAPVVHETPMLRYRPKRHEIYDEYGLNENGEMLYVKRTILEEKTMLCIAQLVENVFVQDSRISAPTAAQRWMEVKHEISE